jgi:hypothetical protein
VEQQQGIDAPQHESFVHHPVHATVEEAAHLRQVAAQGESPATPAILIAAVLAFVVPLAAILMVLAFGIAHFA